MVQDNLAIGIMARNNGCGENGTATFDPTIYTRLSAYYAWLVNTAGLQPILKDQNQEDAKSELENQI